MSNPHEIEAATLLPILAKTIEAQAEGMDIAVLIEGRAGGWRIAMEYPGINERWIDVYGETLSKATASFLSRVAATARLLTQEKG